MTLEQIRRSFVRQPPRRGEPQQYERIREMARGMSIEMASLCPECSERSIALAKLEEAAYWAIASIAWNE